MENKMQMPISKEVSDEGEVSIVDASGDPWFEGTGFDSEGAAADLIVRACNLNAVLLEYFHASNSFNCTVGREDATVEDERKAGERFDVAAVAVRAALAAAEA